MGVVGRGRGGRRPALFFRQGGRVPHFFFRTTPQPLGSASPVLMATAALLVGDGSFRPTQNPHPLTDHQQILDG